MSWRRGGRGHAPERVAVDGQARDGAEPGGLRGPGPIDSLASSGCHRLIRDGARLVESVDDILEELGPLAREVKAIPGEPAVRHPVELTLSDLERAVLGKLDDHPAAVDVLIAQTGMTAAQVMATLSVLEMRRLVRRLPGHQFVRA